MLVFDVMPREEARLAMGSTFALFGVGVTAGPVVAGALHVATGSYQAPMGVAAVFLGVRVWARTPV